MFLSIIVILIIAYIANKLMNTTYEQLNIKPCKLHTWEYGEDGFLYCTTCKGKPNAEFRE